MQDFLHWLGQLDVAGIPSRDLLLALAAAGLSYVLLRGVVGFAAGRLRALSRRTANRADDVLVEVLAGTSRWLLGLTAMLIGLGMLDLGARWSERVGYLWFVALALQLGLWFTRGVGVAVQRYEARRHPEGNGRLSASAGLLSWFLRTMGWAVILLAVLSNLGVDITAFVASLGVGGIAIALAVQNILGDLFASLAIAVDKPFEVGDFIVTGSGQGTVEYVGLKTTHIRSLSGEQIVVGNTDLLKQPVRNFRRMEERRISFRFGITYDTPPDRVEAVPELVRSAIAADDLLRFGRVHFAAFGESSLDFEVVYFVLSPSYDVYMDAQHRLNLQMLRAFAGRGIQFAFPTRTLVFTDSGSAATPQAEGRGGQPARAGARHANALQ
jgi:small-conductance mechanosensitive channel